MIQDKNRRFIIISVLLITAITVAVPFLITLLKNVNEVHQKAYEKRKELARKKRKKDLFRRTDLYTYIISRDRNHPSRFFLDFNAQTKRGIRLVPFVSNLLVTKGGFYLAADLDSRDIGLYRLDKEGKMLWFKKLHGEMNYNDVTFFEKGHRLYISGAYISDTLTLDTETNHIIDYGEGGFKILTPFSKGYLALTDDSLDYFDDSNNRLKHIEFSDLLSKIPQNRDLTKKYRSKSIIVLRDEGVVVLANIRGRNRTVYPWLLRFDSSLRLQGQKVLRNLQGCSIDYGIETRDDKLMITGTCSGLVVLQLDHNGAILWEKRYKKKDKGFVIPKGILELPGEGYLVGVRAANTSILLQIDPKGIIRRQMRYKYNRNGFDAPYNFYIDTMLLTDDDTLFLAGSMQPPGNSALMQEGIVFKTDRHGYIDSPLVTSVPVDTIESIDHE